MRRNKARAGVFLAVCSLLIALGGHATSAASADDESTAGLATSCESTATQAEEGWCDPADLLPDVETLIPQVKALAGSRWAGSYLDRSGETPRQVSGARRVPCHSLQGEAGPQLAG